MSKKPDGDTNPMWADLDTAWGAINAYAKMTAQLAACRLAGHSLDTDEVQELRAAKAAVDLELLKLTAR